MGPALSADCWLAARRTAWVRLVAQSSHIFLCHLSWLERLWFLVPAYCLRYPQLICAVGCVPSADASWLTVDEMSFLHLLAQLPFLFPESCELDVVRCVRHHIKKVENTKNTRVKYARGPQCVGGHSNSKRLQPVFVCGWDDVFDLFV